MLFKRFPISSTTRNLPFRLRWISLGNCCCKGWERKGIWYSFTISKILWSFVRNYHFSTKYFSLPAIWTFGSWPDTSNIFTNLWAYGNFSRGIRVGISFKKVIFIYIFTIVLVVPVEVPAFLLAIAFVTTLPPTMLFAWRGGLSERAGFHLQRL